MKWDWPAILQWAARHAKDAPAFVSLALAAFKAEGLFARMKAVGELYAAIQAILADFPMPSEQVFGATITNDYLLSRGVADADAAEFCKAVGV